LCVFVYTHDVNMCIIMYIHVYKYNPLVILGVTGRVNWDSDSVTLDSPSPVQCNEVI
uniref:Uncharacterized protein n=1 Tax=Amphimedon queenslandica TaxID=400682 RepID=A0A1X7U9S9_AMPQE